MNPFQAKSEQFKEEAEQEDGIRENALLFDGKRNKDEAAIIAAGPRKNMQMVLQKCKTGKQFAQKRKTNHAWNVFLCQ